MNKLLLISGICAAAVVSQVAQAEVKVRAGVAKSSYSAAFGNSSTPSAVYRNKTAISDYTAANIGLTYLLDNGLYFDLGTSSSVSSATHDLWATRTPIPQSFKRTDTAFIVGKAGAFPNGMGNNLYMGLKTGKSNLAAPASLGWTEDIFTASGLVLGGGLSFPLGAKGGSIGVNGGIGFMSATWTDTAGFYAKADSALGASFGLSYTLPFTTAFGLVVDYKGNAYSYTFNSGKTTEFTVDETTGALGLGLYAKF